MSLTLNGKTSAVGTITSPTLTGGCGVLTLSYTNTMSESKGVSFHVDIKQNDAVVKSFDVINTSVTKSTVYTYTSADLNVDGDFVIYIKNNSPSNSSSNKDRVSIFNISWTAYSASGVVKPAMPTITPSSQTFYKAFTATIAAEEGATVYYTTDGEAPTTESTKYESGVEIPAATTTLKAIAVKDGVASNVASAVYTYETLEGSYDNLKALRDGGVTANKYTFTFTDAVVTYVNGQNAYIQDATGGMLVYMSGHGLTAGQKLNGTTVVTYTIYNGQSEITAFTKSDLTVTDGAAITETEVTLADLLADVAKYADMRVKITNATVTAAFSSRSATIEQNGSSIALYDKANTTYENAVADYVVNVVGYPVAYTKSGATTNQIYVWASDDVTLVSKPADHVDAPTISPASQSFSEAFTATITSSASGVMYTLNGTDPSYTSNNGELLTNAPYTVNIPAATTTLKVIAVDDKGNESDVATAVYTFVKPIDATSGSFDNPLTPAQVLANADGFSGKSVWVEGKVLGSVSKNAPGYTTTYSSSSIAIGESGLDTSIGMTVTKNSYLQTALNFGDDTTILGKTVKVYGTLAKYYGRLGFSDAPKYYAFSDEAETLDVKTDEGYATYYNASNAILVPTGMKCGTVKVEDGEMAITYKYEGNETLESGEVLPAATPVLVKAAKGSYPVIYTASLKGTGAGTQNLVGQAETGIITAEDGYHFYKLAYDNYETKADFGFYWGAEDGGVFSVPAGKAYLKVATTSDVAVKAFRFDDAKVTAIENVAAETATAQVKSAYTLDGRRVDASRLTKGIYIVNGKKVIVK